jgi:hypothetical protein
MTRLVWAIFGPLLALAVLALFAGMMLAELLRSDDYTLEQ